MSATKKTGSGGKKKRTTTKRTTAHSKTKKGSKVYIPAYKTISLCLGVIAVCMILLLVSTLSKNSAKTENPEKTSITQRFEPEPEQPKKTSPELSLEEKPKTVKEPEKKPEAKKQDTPKSEPAKNQETKKAQPKNEETKKLDQKEEKQTQPKKTDYGIEKAKNGAQLCFVFDDGGQNLAQLKEFLDLPFPITVAVLPQITHSAEAAELVRKSGNEVILHQPMQSVNANINPGPGAITPDMTEAQIIAQLFVNIDQISPIAGMNNHEGSGITANAEAMEIILKTAEQAGIYFLDSRTNVETTVPYVARELGYSWYERNIFLDNEKTRDNALAELKKGLALANKNGSVIMIGHIWSADFLPALLKEAYPELKEKGYTFSVVSKSKALKN